MNIFEKIGCRLYQKAYYLAAFFIRFREPELLEGEGSSDQAAIVLKKHHCLRPLLVADPGVVKLGLTKPAEAALTAAGISYTLFDGVVPNPTFDLIIDAKALYVRDNCDSIIAIGGGSSMDTGKAVGALVSNPKTNLAKLKGQLKIRHRLPLLVAIPTTAGTGSEATLAAVVVNQKTRDKFSINDPKLIPAVAILDNSLLKGLPKQVIATTGLDALTHAIEAYIGQSGTRRTDAHALEATKLIYENLLAFYEDKEDTPARQGMQRAAYLAGTAFTRAYVGYVHALAHALGGLYDVPHGLANAVLLPHVLRRDGQSVYRKLAQMADYIGLPDRGVTCQGKAASFIAWIEGMNAQMGIPANFAGIIKEEDIAALARHAAKEANPLYPVPLELDEKELAAIYKEVI